MNYNEQITGRIPYGSDSTFGNYNPGDTIMVTGKETPKEDRIFYTDFSITVGAANSYSANLLTFTNCVGFKITQMQFWAYKITSGGVYGAIDLATWTVSGVASGQSYPTASRSYGVGATGYNNFFRVAQDPDFHQLNWDGPIYVQQGNTFQIDFVMYSTFALNDVLKSGVTVTWQEL